MDYKEEGRKKTQKGDWKALLRDKKKSRNVIAEAARRAFQEARRHRLDRKVKKKKRPDEGPPGLMVPGASRALL